jgi:hypothetical protein
MWSPRAASPRFKWGVRAWGALGVFVTLMAALGYVLDIRDLIAGGDDQPAASSPPVLPLELRARASADAPFADSVSALPGSRLQLVAQVRNLGGLAATEVVVRLDLPAQLQLKAGSCRMRTSSNGELRACDDNFAGGGLLHPQIGGGAWVQYFVDVRLAHDAPRFDELLGSASVNSNETPEESDDVRVYVNPSVGRFRPDRPLLDPGTRRGRAATLGGPIVNSVKGDYGDERQFLDVRRVRDVNPGSHTDLLSYPLRRGGIHAIRLYVRNGADPSTNDGRGMARRTSVRLELPTGSSEALRVRGYVSIDNPARGWPGLVEDTVDFADDRPFRLDYVPGSVRAYFHGDDRGLPLSDEIVDDGVQLGFRNLSGYFPGGERFAATVQIRVRARR